MVYGRQIAVLTVALLGAALILLGLAPQAQVAPGETETCQLLALRGEGAEAGGEQGEARPGGESRATGANYGTWVNVVAPGGESSASSSQRILSSVPTSVSRSGYAAWNGTSMASPFVAGVAALLSSQGLSNTQGRQRIESTATDLGAAGKDQIFGNGLVNAQAAVTNSARSKASTQVLITPSKKRIG